MGNTVAATTQSGGNGINPRLSGLGDTPGQSGNSMTVSEMESERRFLERMAYIYLIESQAAGTPGDLVSSLRGNSHSWATSVTSITDEFHMRAARLKEQQQLLLQQDYLHKHLKKEHQLQHETVGAPPQVVEIVTPRPKATAVATAVNFPSTAPSKSHSKHQPFQPLNDMKNIDLPHQSHDQQNKEPQKINSDSLLINPSQLLTPHASGSHKSMSSKSRSKSETDSQLIQHFLSNSKSQMVDDEGITKSQPSNTGTECQGSKSGSIISQQSPEVAPALQSTPNKSLTSGATQPTNSTMTEHLIVEMQRKMVQFDKEQDLCLQQIKNMNEEMESYREETQQQLQAKDSKILQQREEIASLKQQLLHVKVEKQDEQQSSVQETRELLGQLSTLQNKLKVAEMERDAAITAVAAAREGVSDPSLLPSKPSMTDSSTSNSTVSYSSVGMTSHTPQAEDLRETIQELLQQLEESEEEHQREQLILQEEILLLRKKLQRLEHEHITIQQQRDEALHEQAVCEKQLQVQKALNQSDLNRYKAELARWKERYVQEMRFSNGTSTDNSKRSAVTLGNRLGAGILEGIKEEIKQPHNHKGYSVDESEAYSRLVGMLTTLSAADSFGGGAPQAVPSVATSTSSSDSAPVYIPEDDNHPLDDAQNGKIRKGTSQAFAEEISIPKFLSKVW